MRKVLTLPLLTLSLGFLASCGSMVDEHPKSRSSGETSSEESSEETPKTYKVLFIGNSFTHYNDLDIVSQEIGRSAGLDISCDRVAISAHHLYEYADDNDEGAKLINEKLNNNSYTHIILQEHSTYPVSNYNSFLNGATALVNKIKAKAPDSEIRLYQTWGFENMVGNYGSSIAECENRLCEAYKNVAKALDIKIHYVGKAFTKWLETNSSISPYYSGDNKHPSFLGTYLAGLMHVVSLSGVNLDKVTYQGEKGTYNNYGETYVDDSTKNAAIVVAKNIYQNYGINY